MYVLNKNKEKIMYDIVNPSFTIYMYEGDLICSDNGPHKTKRITLTCVYMYLTIFGLRSFGQISAR